MATVVEHWWGVEITFTKAEKEELLLVVGAAVGLGGGAAAGSEGVRTALVALGISLEVIAPLVVVLFALLLEIAACNLVGSGGFRIVIPRIMLPGLPPGFILPN